MDQADYIVIGGGSSGCIVAAELSEDPSVAVLLLEAGDSAESHPETLVADGYKQAFINEQLMWDRFSTPQSSCANHRLFMGSGRGLGGSGSINAMVYTRGDQLDYASWNVDGWSWDSLVPDFQAVEARLRVRRLPPTEFTETCIRAAEQCGFSRKEDLNDGRLNAFLGYEWMNLDGNERRSSYVSFLKPALARPNLSVKTGAAVRRILVESGRATGVELEADGRIHVVHCRREIILCAGALESPRLLLLSGIGPADELRALGLPVAADLPGVGRNLMDHPNVSIFFKGARPTDCHWAQLYGFHRANPDSPLAKDQADTCYVFYSARSSFREGVIRLLPSMILPMWLYRLNWPARFLRSLIKLVFGISFVKRLVERMYGIVVILGKPESRGRLRLRSADPREPALIDPAYFHEARDLQALVDGVRLARRIAAAAPLAEWGNRELIPGARTATDEKVADFVRKNAMTTYHYAGTCRIGDGPDAVVDERLRVRGVAGLRVADASVIPSVPVSAMNAPSMVIGYRAARFIRAGR